MPPDFWHIQPEWLGETVFIVAGGPSFKSVDVEALRGQKIIVINSSWMAVPFADFLIFADARWWEVHRLRLNNWAGRIVCCSRTPRDKKLLLVKRKAPPSLSEGLDTLIVQYTTATAAIDLAVKLGAAKIVLLGLDGRNTDGKTHHHHAHPWRQVPGWESKHRRDLIAIAGTVKQKGVEVVLGTPSAYEDIWPRIDLAEVLQVTDVAA